MKKIMAAWGRWISSGGESVGSRSCKFAAEMNPRSSTKESVLRIFTKFMCSLSGTEQLDFRDGHPATLHALFGLLIGDDVMLKMFAAMN